MKIRNFLISPKQINFYQILWHQVHLHTDSKLYTEFRNDSIHILLNIAQTNVTYLLILCMATVRLKGRTGLIKIQKPLVELFNNIT